MGGIKIDHKTELNADHVEWLKEMASKYDLPDEHTALRCVLDYAIDEADADTIFTEMRCRHCG